MADVMSSAEMDALLGSQEEAIRYLARRDVIGEDPDSRSMRSLRRTVRGSARVGALLAARERSESSTYRKWLGAHWVIMHLAALGCRGDDRVVRSLVDEVLNRWTAPQHLADREVERAVSGQRFVPVVAGRSRRCASQQGGALWAALELGYRDDPRIDVLAARLTHWQWPDGGWNCDRRPTVEMSSVNESFLPLQGLAVHGGHPLQVDAASEFLLDRHVAYRRTNGEPLHSSVIQMHFPAYWHYDFLAGLDSLRIAGKLADPRCDRALTFLESHRLEGGGWPATAKWYQVREEGSNIEAIDWGPTHARRPNPWTTLIALRVLIAAGRRP